jgi:anti-sigma regulatory factor (Ser/Thr protein kinase)/PAS domain-containing protein
MSIQDRLRRYRKNRQIIFGVIFLIVIIVTTGVMGFYSIYKSNQDSKDYIDAVDHAREVQVLMQKQFQTWRRIVMEGDDPVVYRREYLIFSRYSAMIQDLLFNLKTACSDFNGIPLKIGDLAALHNSISTEYITLLVELNDKGFARRGRVIDRAGGKDERILRGIDEIVAGIKSISEAKVSTINTFYLNMLLGSLIVQLLIASVFSFNLARRIIVERSRLESNIREKSRDLAETGKTLRLSEEKYRRIVENSDEIIFTLDDGWNVVTVNSAVKKHFNIAPEKLQGRYLLDFIRDDMDGNDLSGELVKSNLERFSRERTPVQFKVDFKMPYLKESRTMNMRLERLDVEGIQEVLGRASIAAEDSIQKYILRERLAIEIGNSIVAADEVTFRITELLDRRLGRGEGKMIRLALREIIINAIEHGNLGISFSEKSAALAADDYFNLLSRRQAEKTRRGRMVSIDYALAHDRVTYRITDQGEGFDHAAVMKRDANDESEGLLPHGRGIQMTIQIFDEVRYNTKGNQVLLVKRFRNT